MCHVLRLPYMYCSAINTLMIARILCRDTSIVSTVASLHSVLALGGARLAPESKKSREQLSRKLAPVIEIQF